MSVVAVPTEHGQTLVAEETELLAFLARLVAEGRLTPAGYLGSGYTPDGRAFARVQLLPLPAPERPRAREVSPNVVAAALVTATVLVVSWLVVLLVGHLLQVVVIAAIVIAVLLWLSSGGSKHCPGCKG